MGLQSQLNDVASDSIPILLLALIAAAVGHLRSLAASVCYSVGLHRRGLHPFNGGDLDGLFSVSDHLSLNAGDSSYFRCGCGPGDDSPGCVFCLCGINDGDCVRRLDCRHVFHKECLDGWIDQRKFHCPLCRSPLVPRWRVDQVQRRLGVELIAVR